MSALSLHAVRGQVLSGVRLELAGGLHVVLGAPHDGATELIELCAGAALPRSGSIRVAARDPAADPELRRRIGAALPNEALPPAASVADAVRRVLVLRGDAADGARPLLEELGLAALLPRAPQTLSPSELGAVALALALSVRDPLLLALHEPLLRARALNPERIRARLLAAADAGAVVLCTTASARDAVTLSDTVLVLDRGRISRSPAPALTELVPGHAPEFQVVTPAARALAALLSAEPDVAGVTLDGGAEPSFVRVRAADAAAGAAAISRAVVQGRIPLHALYMTLPELESVRAATAALAGVAHAQAQRAALAYYGVPR